MTRFDAFGASRLIVLIYEQCSAQSERQSFGSMNSLCDWRQVVPARTGLRVESAKMRFNNENNDSTKGSKILSRNVDKLVRYPVLSQRMKTRNSRARSGERVSKKRKERYASND